jgi:cardiolipin synthase A/B
MVRRPPDNLSAGFGFSVFWGAEYDHERESRNADEAAKIMRTLGENPDTANRFHIDMRTTGSHAKILLADTITGDWVAAIGSRRRREQQRSRARSGI